MLPADVILLVMVLVIAGWRLWAPRWQPQWRRVAVTIGLLLAAVHWWRYDFTWQAVPAYLLLLASAMPPRHATRMQRWLGRASMSVLAVATASVWLVEAVPTLPRPDGRYAVGTQVFRWTDTTRSEPHTPDTTDRRSVIAQAWYPTDRQSGGASANAWRAERTERVAYIDGLDQMPTQVSVMPGFMLHRYGQIDTHAAPGAALAPPAPGERPWPVVLFLPGYGAPRAVYTGLLTQLASRGLIVFALDHPFESAVTQLPDGHVVSTRETLLPGERNRSGYMARQQAVRVADAAFVLDQLTRARTLTSRSGVAPFDASHVAVIGHSFGGAAASAALLQDTRVVAAVNIDGTPYGDLPTRVLTQPFLLLQSDVTETHHGDAFLNGNGALLAHMTAPGFRYEITHANHYSFTDAPYFLAPPARWMLTTVLGGRRGPAVTQRVTAEVIAAFLAGPLTGIPGNVAATAARYPGVVSDVSPKAATGSPRVRTADTSWTRDTTGRSIRR
jgi:dienelactone hydrolase